MKHQISLLLLSITLIALFSCKKPNVNDDYYVKYEVESTSTYHSVPMNTTIRKADGTLVEIRMDKGLWQTTIGPVDKGFNASLKVVKNGWSGEVENHLRLKLRIHVSKNDEPFALKQQNISETPRATAETQYAVQ